ncbi:MAG: hypothetical protein AB8B93_10490 [Pseudomonadales bacterium]
MALDISHKWHFTLDLSEAAEGPRDLALVAAHSTGDDSTAREQSLQLAMVTAGANGPLPTLQFAPRRAPRAAGWLLSYAHSGEWLLAAAMAIPSGTSGLSRAAGTAPQAALGIDIERLRSRNHSRLARFLGWRGDSLNLGHFYRRWTLAEALLKALGGAHAKATFNALDSALQTKLEVRSHRQAVVGDWRYHVVWPQFDGAVVGCWLVAEPVARLLPGQQHGPD